MAIIVCVACQGTGGTVGNICGVCNGKGYLVVPDPKPEPPKPPGKQVS